MNRPFVIVVASEKGGVGKTTIATNLAVYLKALREDLPVTIGSFDNHFSVDQMFALGARPERDISSLLEGIQPADLAVLGQYGVQYMASSRRLQAPPHAPGWIRQQLHAATLPGVLILDTRPILDWFTEAALLAADLVLVPIKDRAALINADALRQVLNAVERVDRLWLLPSLVDARARLNTEIKVHEFLIYAARERDYQVLDICISKSPKVESLASGFSSKIRPVLTHARNTSVHGQLKQLSEFALSSLDAGSTLGTHQPGLVEDLIAEVPNVHRRYLGLECPHCCSQSLTDGGVFYFDLRSRRRGFIHSTCFDQFCDVLSPGDDEELNSLFAMTIDGPGMVAPECRLTMHLFDTDGGLVESNEIGLDDKPALVDLLSAITGRSLDLAYRELILVNCCVQSAEILSTDGAYRRFVMQRRQVARELRDAGLF